MFDRALVLHRAGQLSAAAQQYKAILRIDRAHAGALCNLGIIHLRESDHDEAVRMIRKALYAKPNWHEALTALGLAQQARNRHSEAVEPFLKAISAKPDHMEARIALVDTLQHLDRHDEALAQAERAVALAPDNPWALAC
jgi:protein O-GlcNAc transferase